MIHIQFLEPISKIKGSLTLAPKHNNKIRGKESEGLIFLFEIDQDRRNAGASRVSYNQLTLTE
jgi:hypothetical protein